MYNRGLYTTEITVVYDLDKAINITVIMSSGSSSKYLLSQWTGNTHAQNLQIAVEEDIELSKSVPNYYILTSPRVHLYGFGCAVSTVRVWFCTRLHLLD